MPTHLNKKILCFIDEYGTPGVEDLYLGAVFVMSREAGRVDKCFSDLLEPSANEIHAVNLNEGYLQGLMQRFWLRVPANCVVLLNQSIAKRGGKASVLYAHAVIETVKIGLKRFKEEVLERETIGNVDVITDVSEFNDHPDFDAEIAKARRTDGRFKGVNRVARLDSAASRLLQLADVVAYSRKWINGADINAARLRQRFGINVG